MGDVQKLLNKRFLVKKKSLFPCLAKLCLQCSCTHRRGSVKDPKPTVSLGARKNTFGCPISRPDSFCCAQQYIMICDYHTTHGDVCVCKFQSRDIVNHFLYHPGKFCFFVFKRRLMSSIQLHCSINFIQCINQILSRKI